MSNLEIRRFVAISTSHLSEVTANRLDSTPSAEWPCCDGRYGYYGWFVYAHEENFGVGDDAIPGDLFAVMTWARRQNCEYVLFDCDAEAVDELATYDW